MKFCGEPGRAGRGTRPDVKPERTRDQAGCQTGADAGPGHMPNRAEKCWGRRLARQGRRRVFDDDGLTPVTGGEYTDEIE